MADYFKDQMGTTEDDDIIILYNEETDKDEEYYELATLDVDEIEIVKDGELQIKCLILYIK